MPKDKLGKNEAKRAAAAGLRELDQEMTEEERQRAMHKTVKEHIHKGEDEIFGVQLRAAPPDCRLASHLSPAPHARANREEAD